MQRNTQKGIYSAEGWMNVNILSQATIKPNFVLNKAENGIRWLMDIMIMNMNKSSKYGNDKYAYPYNVLFPVNDLETTGQSYDVETLEKLATFWGELVDIIEFYLQYSMIISDTTRLNEIYMSLLENIKALLDFEGSGNFSQHCPKLHSLLDEYDDSPQDYYRHLNIALFDFWEKIQSVHPLKKMARVKIETENKNFFDTIENVKRSYLLSFSKGSSKSATSTRKDRDLYLIWTGFDVVDLQNPDLRITPRNKKDFPGKVLSICFKNYKCPNRTIFREELDMQPKQIKLGLKNIVTSWSTKFDVSRQTIKKIIHLQKDGSVRITEALKFGSL